MGAPNHLIAGGWHQSELPTMLWETSLLETMATSQQLGWQESRIPFVLSSSPSLYQLYRVQTSCSTHLSGELPGKLWRPGFVLYFG